MIKNNQGSAGIKVKKVEHRRYFTNVELTQLAMDLMLR